MSTNFNEIEEKLKKIIEAKIKVIWEKDIIIKKLIADNDKLAKRVTELER